MQVAGGVTGLSPSRLHFSPWPTTSSSGPTNPHRAAVPGPESRSGPSEQDHVTWSAQLFFRGEGYGWEVQILRNGELTIGRRFLLREEAVAWAEAEKAHAGGGEEWVE